MKKKRSNLASNSSPRDPSDDVANLRRDFLIATLDQYECRLTAYAVRLLHGDLERARDIVQIAFLKLCEQPFKEIEPKVAAWLYTVVRNRIVDDKRMAASANQALDFECHDERVSDPSERAERMEFLKYVRQSMDNLPDTQREVVDLWSHGFRTKEIADITSMECGTVRVNLHRAIKFLRGQPEIADWLVDQSTDDGKREAPNSSFRKRIDRDDVGQKLERATGSCAKPIGSETEDRIEDDPKFQISGNQTRIQITRKTP